MGCAASHGRGARSLLLLAAALTAAALCHACRARPALDHPRADVVLVSIDSLRADHVGALGYARRTTPALDALAVGGALFTNAVSSTSWTLPAHAALLTGLPDSAHGATTVRSRLSEQAVTLPEILREHGYRTIGLYAGPFLHPDFGLAQGFDEYLDCTSYGLGSSRRPLAKLHTASHKDRTNPLVLARAADAIASLGDQPFFLFIHLWDVHYDLIPPAPYHEMFQAPTGGDARASSEVDGYTGSRYRHDPRFTAGMDAADFARTVALYDGEIRYTDDTLGRILSRLAQHLGPDRARHTLTVVTSDHGDEFLDHGGKGHRHTLFQELIRIPLVFHMPARVAPVRVAATASIIDVAPTILDLIGIETPAGMMGSSLAASIDGHEEAGSPARAALAELRAPPRARALSAVVQGDHKLIVDEHRDAAEYYDLADDPAERRPLPARQRPEGRQLLAELARLRSEAAAKRVGPASTDTQAPAALTPSVREALEELGYID